MVAQLLPEVALVVVQMFSTGGGGGVPTRGAATSGLSGISSAGIQTPISDMIAADTARMPQAFAEQQAVLAQNRFNGFRTSRTI